ncbi:MAG: hypothetical protein JNM18_14535, partial [Planctomycetaceae bacterium]|nr:hypothetical protein [Planctomycetaceae bacterium]
MSRTWFGSFVDRWSRLWSMQKPRSGREASNNLRRRGLSFQPLEQRTMLAVLPELVRDIFPGASNASPGFFAEVNGTLYFRARDATNGYELWKSDGSSAGTLLVNDINTGANSANPKYLTNVNGTLYFSANDGTNGYELWKSDGSSMGTVLVQDIRPGASGANPQ